MSDSKTPRIIPNVFYNDLAAAIEWLEKSFNFATRIAMPGPDGSLMHAEMNVEDSHFMMSPAEQNESWVSPSSNNGAVTQSLYIFVDDVDAHCAKARSAGANIIAEPEDAFWGDRTYVVEDIEGHRWTFATHVRDVAPEDMKPPGA